MIARCSLTAEDVAAALATGDEVRDIEPRRRPGTWSSLFHAFRVERPAPRRASVVQVFPYDDAQWRPAIDEAITWEVAGWRGFWTWVREDLPPDPGGIFRIPPLAEPVDEAVSRLEVRVGSAVLIGVVRPFLDWPDLAEASVPEAEVATLWPELAAMVQALAPRWAAVAGRGPEVPPNPSAFPEHRRRLLSDGRHLVPTSWRGFDPALRRLDEGRLRTPATT